MLELQRLLQKHGVSEEQFRKDPEEFAMLYLLKGEKKHYCPEWDWMAIDETCPEFGVCTCYDN